MPDIGDEMIYRLREYAESERVRVVEIDVRKKTPRYVVEFLSGDKAGGQENVPAGRLRGPWVEVGAYDSLMANWERIDQVQLTDVEDSAVGQVFDLLIRRRSRSGSGRPCVTRLVYATGKRCES